MINGSCDLPAFICLLYIALNIFNFCRDSKKKFRQKRFRERKAKLKELAEMESAEMRRNLLIEKLYWLGYEENAYLREDDTSIFESFINHGDYFRLGDDGSFSSRRNTVNLDELRTVN